MKPRWQMGLPVSLILALRYLRSSRRDAYASFLSTLATGGIALGVAALILVLGGLSGLQDFLRTDVLARTPHLEIEVGDADPEGLRQTLLAVPGVLEAQRILRGRGWLLISGTAVAVEAVGYEGEVPRSFPEPVRAPLPFDLAAGAEPPDGDGLYLGADLARRWSLEVGDHLEIVSPRPTLTPFGPQPRLHKLRLSGTFRTGRTEDQDPRLALPIDAARRLFGDARSRLEVRTESLESALALAPEIAAALPPTSELRTWKDLNRGLFFALRLEKVMMFVAVFLIVPVAAMSLITVLALLISSKRGEIGILEAMGATPRELGRAFLILGGLLGGAGLLAGGLLGTAAAWILDRYELVTPPGDVYFLDHIPFRLEAGDLFTILLATVLLIAASTVYAARRAAAGGPIEALRGRT